MYKPGSWEVGGNGILGGGFRGWITTTFPGKFMSETLPFCKVTLTMSLKLWQFTGNLWYLLGNVWQL